MTTLDNNPMISISVRVWRMFGYIYQKDARRYLSLIPNYLLIALMISYLLFSGDSLEDLTLSSFFTVILVNCMVSGCPLSLLYYPLSSIPPLDPDRVHHAPSPPL